MQRYAEFRVLGARVHRAGDGRLQVTGHRHEFQYTPRPGYLYVRARAISSRTNDNHDDFPAEEIKAGYRTFVGKPVFVNHHNEDPSRARGVIVDAALHEDTNPDGTPDTWVELLHEVDAIKFPRLAQAILNGEIDRTSMGTNVEYSLCSFCDNKAQTPLEYCSHIKSMKGQRIIRTTASGKREAVLVAERCYGLSFFENSLLVEPPADPTAVVLGVDSRGLDTPLATTASRRVTAERFDEGAGDDHNAYHISGCHHTSCGRWLGRTTAAGESDTLEGRLERAHPSIDPVRFVVEGAREYSRAHGLEDPHAASYEGVRTNPGRARRIGTAYDALPADDPKAHAAFSAMRDQVDDQYHHLTHRMGVKVEPVDYDPYPDHKAMAADLAKKRLRVLSTKTTGAHPIFTDEENDRFRAVHDAFGHAATGRAFDGHGEEAAWLAHSRMFHGIARQAMTSETRGQNGSLLVNRKFSPQKIALLPAALHEREARRRPKGREDQLPDPRTALLTEAKPRHADPGQHPWYQANPVHPDNIVAHYDRATDEEKDLGHRWYADAHHVAKALGRTARPKGTEEEAAHVGAGVLAAYSPQSAWPVNMLNASHALRTGKAPGGKGSGVFATASMAGQAQRVMNGERHENVLVGPKIRDFAHLIEHGGDADPEHPHVVIDRHALSVAAGRRLHDKEIGHAPLDNPHYYGHTVSQYHTAAKMISEREGVPVQGHQVQATTWLVRQRENAEADAAGGSGAEKGRGRGRQKAVDAWDQHARKNYPELVGPGYHRGRLQATAYGEQVAPPQVDTLRPEDCPICGDRETFDGNRCQVCGYVAPPEQFTDPNLELAQQVDLRGGQDPEEGEPPPPGEEDEDPESEEDIEDRPLNPTGRRHPEGAEVRMGTTGNNQAQRQRNRLMAALTAQQEQLRAQRTVAEAQAKAIASLGQVLAFVVDVAGLSEHPKVAGLVPPPAPAQRKSASYRAGYRTGQQDRRTRANVALPAKIAEFDGADADWQIGWDDGYHEPESAAPGQGEALASRRTGADETGEPVARSNEQALAPDAIDNPENYGTAPASANTGVTPAATTDVQSPNVALPAEPFNSLEDVTEQRDLVPPPPGEASHVPEDIQKLENPVTAPAFPVPGDGGWTASRGADPQARFMAALRLAKLRREAGIDDTDELALAQSIMSGPGTDGEIDIESRTLAAVTSRARQAPPATDVRSLVPRSAHQRAMPSLATASSAPARRVQASSNGVGPDPAEFGDI